MTTYNIVAATNEATVVAECKPTPYTATSYQSESALEADFIQRLTEQGYEPVRFADEAALISNLRRQLERLNAVVFSDTEWESFFKTNLASANEGIEQKTRRIQEDHVQLLRRDDGSTKNIRLIDKVSIHNNNLQVLSQYSTAGGAYANRYDVTILVNGFPLVHVELKRRGVDIREAFNQISRYQRDSFWADSGLFDYVQLFVISNGTHTKYYSNTTRYQHIKEFGLRSPREDKKTSNSFKFTSYWADSTNRTIPDLVDFTRTFFAKHTLLNLLIRYCVFTSEELLLVMRPYQIVAAEQILNRIASATNQRVFSNLKAGGYIWHTTGSGKTLTSFKAAQLATRLPGVDKVLFVVDRKDLDHQTMKEYDKFQKGAANSNASTRVLQRQLEDPEARIIITTIQKLSKFVSRNPAHPVYASHMVLIFDECHRSQFGQMHRDISRAFKKYHLFGFTGTPIFAVNAPSGVKFLKKTTEQVFGEKLHTYTIVDAIRDENVLPFRIDFISTFRMKDDVQDEQVQAIDRERAMMAPDRLRQVTTYLLDHFDQKTSRSKTYKLGNKRLNGFNAIFAVSSIPMAMAYYSEFKRQQAERPEKLKIATIYSFSQNEPEPDGLLPEEEFETDRLDKPSRDFLEGAIQDYNRTFGTSYDTSSEKFEGYYKDLSRRVKEREVDLLLVVDMFLTGFDATTLNTLWVDKNLRQHGLMQAFSRTNRILNTVKSYGNIVCFRDLKQETDDAIALFGDKDAGGVVLMKTFEEYYNGYDDGEGHKPGYVELVETLRENFPMDVPIVGEAAEKEFVRLFGSILKLRNILTAFDEFEGHDALSERALQDYQSVYIDIWNRVTERREIEREDIIDDLVFEIELIKQIEVNIDYILMLVAKYHATNCTDKTILDTIGKAIDSSIELRSKKSLIEGFIAQVNSSTDVEGDWPKYVAAEKDKDLTGIIDEENLKPDLTRSFMQDSFRDGQMRTTGTRFDKILPPMSRFAGGGRTVKKQNVITKLKQFFEKYLGLGD